MTDFSGFPVIQCLSLANTQCPRHLMLAIFGPFPISLSASCCLNFNWQYGFLLLSHDFCVAERYVTKLKTLIFEFPLL